MNTKISGYIGRNTEVCFYDVTNFYFEISDNDADVLDADGKVVREGIRKRARPGEKRGTYCTDGAFY